MPTALLLVDAQRNMLEGDEAVPAAAELGPALADLLRRARSTPGAVVVHVQNDGPEGAPDQPGTAGWELVNAPVGSEVVVRKDEPDAFVSNPRLAPDLREAGVDRVVVAGMQSEWCVRETGLGALQHGFTVVLASGAHGTYDDDAGAAEIGAQVEEELRGEGVQVLPATAVRFD